MLATHNTKMAPRMETTIPAGWNGAPGLGRTNKCEIKPPIIEPTMPSTSVHKSVMCMCITDFATKPAIKPTIRYQMK